MKWIKHKWLTLIWNQNNFYKPNIIHIVFKLIHLQKKTKFQLKSCNSKTMVAITVTMHFCVIFAFIFDATLPIDLVRKRTLTMDEGFLWINWQKLYLCLHFSCLFWGSRWCVLWKHLDHQILKKAFNQSKSKVIY